MSNDKKVLHKSKKNAQGKVVFDGSVSLGGKDSPQGIVKGKPKSSDLQNLLAKSGGEYNLATQEFFAKRELQLAKIKKDFTEILSPEAKIAYFKSGGWHAFGLADLMSKEDLPKYVAATDVLKKQLKVVEDELKESVTPFLTKRNKDFAEAKAKHPKKFWQSRSAYLGSVCEKCGAQVTGSLCTSCSKYSY